MSEPERTAQVWDQQRGESDKAYAAYTAYYRLGVRRSYRKVGQELGKSDTLIGRWGARWGWVERVRAQGVYDLEMERAEFAEERRRAARNDARVLSSLVAKVGAAVMALDPAELKPEQLIRLADVTLKHRRTLYGPVDEAPVHVHGTVGDMPVSVEVERFDRLPAAGQARELEELAARVLRVREAIAAAA
ncbi:hypothetical protein [Streptomyces sp. NPDC087300]|uniref:hypothetical protein n=1 Tax=Streptomyces sp. NPDC087300 TaxID=3365780 RepID=UPI003801122D